MWNEQLRKHIIKPDLAFKQACSLPKTLKKSVSRSKKKFVWHVTYCRTPKMSRITWMALKWTKRRKSNKSEKKIFLYFFQPVKEKKASNVVVPSFLIWTIQNSFLTFHFFMDISHIIRFRQWKGAIQIVRNILVGWGVGWIWDSLTKWHLR